MICYLLGQAQRLQGKSVPQRAQAERSTPLALGFYDVDPRVRFD